MPPKLTSTMALAMVFAIGCMGTLLCAVLADHAALMGAPMLEQVAYYVALYAMGLPTLYIGVTLLKGMIRNVH